MTLQEQKKYIADNYLKIPIKRIAINIGRSHCFVVGEMKRQNLVVPKWLAEKRKKEYCFQKGHKPFNKGLRQCEFMNPESIERTKKTRYKKGNEPHNTKFDYCISKRHDTSGIEYFYIRIQKAEWIPLQRYVWEQHNGKIPNGYNVQFKDNDQSNCDIENLYLVSRKEQAIHNKNGGSKLPYELKKTITNLNKLKSVINAKQNI